MAALWHASLLRPCGAEDIGDPQIARASRLHRATAAAANAGFAEGADTAFLIASEMGEPVYHRIGFRTIEDYRFWLPPTSDLDR